MHGERRYTVINRSRGAALHVIFILTSYTFIQVRIVSILASKPQVRSCSSCFVQSFTFHKVLVQVSLLSVRPTTVHNPHVYHLYILTLFRQWTVPDLRCPTYTADTSKWYQFSIITFLQPFEIGPIRITSD